MKIKMCDLGKYNLSFVLKLLMRNFAFENLCEMHVITLRATEIMCARVRAFKQIYDCVHARRTCIVILNILAIGDFLFAQVHF